MRKFLAVAVAAMALSLPAVAETDGADPFLGEEIDVSFEASQTRLISDNYRNVTMLNGNALQLLALDPQDSQVQLTISPLSGEIDSSTYDYEMDR